MAVSTFFFPPKCVLLESLSFLLEFGLLLYLQGSEECGANGVCQRLVASTFCYGFFPQLWPCGETAYVLWLTALAELPDNGMN